MAADVTQVPAVAVEGVSKTFRLPNEQVHTLKERALHPLRRTRYDELNALRDVSFEVQPGEFFGVVGRNGSGKSTLLKCLAGIYRADHGRMYLRGRVAPFIELGVGFNPNLPARDNVIINAVMLGLTPADARSRIDKIIRFAELEEFVDLRLKNYSSGMHVRLAFAVMVEVDADILLIDEVLAVGDAAFQQKCHDTLHQRRQSGRTILFVTHDMNTVERLCDRALLLERGELVELGNPQSVSRRYNRINFDSASYGGDETHGLEGDGAASILDAWFEDERGERIPALEQGRRCSFHSIVEFRRHAVDPIFGFSLADEHHRDVFVTSSQWEAGGTGEFEAGERVEIRVAFENVFTPGRYFASPLVSHEGTGAKLMARREEMVTVVVLGSRRGGGTVDLPHELTISPVSADAARGLVREGKA